MILSPEKLPAILMALTAYSFISIGFVLQKQGIHWMGWKGQKNKTFYKNLALWVTGFVIMNIYGVPSAIALKTLPSHIVAACAGWGIVALVFLSHFFLKEKLFNSDYFYSFLVVAGIVLLNLFEKPAPDTPANITGLILLGAFPVVLLAAGFNRKLSPKVKTIVFASVAGLTAALMVVFLKLLVLNHQYHVARYLRSPYLYLYIGVALISLAALQLAFKNGPMMITGPVQYATTIIYPAIAAFFVFNRLIGIIQVAAVAMIVYAVTAILRKR